MSDTLISADSNRFLLDRVSPAVRKVLVRERIRAMRGRFDDAVRTLKTAGETVGDRPHDAVALGMLRAELLHLEFRHDEAGTVFDKTVIPYLTSLLPDERFAAEQNQSDVRFSTDGSGTDSFYDLVDRRRLHDFDWLDYQELFSAVQKARGGEHFTALPVLWQQHRRAFRNGCWLARQWTDQLLATECAQLEQWEDAVNYAVLGRNGDSLGDIAAGILETRDVELVARVVSRLLKTANLRAHFVSAAKLLKALADAVPDEAIPEVGEWLLERAKQVRESFTVPDFVSDAWDGIAALGERFSKQLADDCIKAAVHHPYWTTELSDPNRVLVERQAVVRSIAPLSSATRDTDIPALIEAVLPLILGRRQISDYHDVIALLCRLAGRADPATRRRLAAALYPENRPILRALASVADLFGEEQFTQPERLRSFADVVASEIKAQVRRLRPGENPEPVGEEILQMTDSVQSIRVSMVALVGLHTLVRQRKWLDPESIKTILSAILQSTRDRDNFCINRARLLDALTNSSDVVSSKDRFEIVQVLEPLARGDVEESQVYPDAAAVDHPLNPFKTRTGRPEDVQAAALVALAAFATGSASSVVAILEDALCNSSAVVRRAAYQAAVRLPKPQAEIVSGVLAGLRDPDPGAAVAAFIAFAERVDWKLNRLQWRNFLMSVRIAQSTGDAGLRRKAASALAARRTECPHPLADLAGRLLDLFHNDICRSVRIAVRRPTVDEGEHSP